MDLVKLLSNSNSVLTSNLSADKAYSVNTILEKNGTDIGHLLAHVNSIAADGKLTVADIPDVVMFCVELFTFVSNTSHIAFSKDDIFTLAENAVIIIVSAPRFALTALEIKIAINVADTCFVLAKKVVNGSGYCSNWCSWFCRRTSAPPASVPNSVIPNTVIPDIA